ncbi:MAG: PRD domain-containing protein [Lachnospiraceae bacterium]
MIIKQIINNNVIFVADDNGHEMVLMGRGIGFGKKAGDNPDVARVEKLFARFDQKQMSMLKRLAEEIPYEHLHIANEIINYAQVSLGKKLDESLFIALTDHLNFAISRSKQGIVLPNAMLWEIRHYYNREYRIGIEALAIVKRYLRVELPDDEAGFVAMHILNSELNLGMEQANAMTRMIQDVLNIVQYHFRIMINEESLDYERFVTHLKFFIQRTMHETQPQIWEKNMQDLIRIQYEESYKCAKKIAAYMKRTTPYSVPDEELIYLTVHIQRLLLTSKQLDG